MTIRERFRIAFVRSNGNWDMCDPVDVEEWIEATVREVLDNVEYRYIPTGPNHHLNKEFQKVRKELGL